MIRFDVFGKRIDAERGPDGWRLYEPGGDGKRRALDLPVPAYVNSEAELIQYLDDIYHEAATPMRPAVRRLA